METAVSLACAVMELLGFRELRGIFRPERSRLALWSLGVLLCLLTFLPLPEPALVGIRFALYAAVLLLTTQGKWWQSLLIALLGAVLPWLLTEGLLHGTAAVFSFRMAELYRRQRNTLTLLLTGRSMALLLCWLLRRFCTRSQLRWSLLALVLPLVTLVMLAVTFFAHMGRNDLSEVGFFSCCLLTAANVGMPYLLRAAESSNLKNQELALLLQQQQIQTESILALEESHEAHRRSSHDFQHHLLTIGSLLERGEHAAALNYVQLLQNGQLSRVFSINSHHPIVDAVLNQKYQTARAQGIQIQVQVNDLSRLGLEQNHLVVLLSNLLDNATEACLRLEGERAIRCSFLLQEELLFLSVANTSPPVKFTGRRLPSSKRQGEGHGYGLVNVCDILKRYGAEYTFEYSEGWFRFAAEIPTHDR
ncbi:MAG: sensor histidine kinase [Oscillospiraceae bacterium]|nr:sensor histidine kinase [Oscillospiraceae bacterium]